MTEKERLAIRLWGYIEVNRVYITEEKAFQLFNNNMVGIDKLLLVGRDENKNTIYDTPPKWWMSEITFSEAAIDFIEHEDKPGIFPTYGMRGLND